MLKYNRGVYYMIQNIEKEYKVLLTEFQYQQLISLLSPNKPVKQTNYYYDTIDHQIQNKKGAMRIREKNGKYIFTLKIRKDQDSLFEYEKIVQTNDSSVFLDKDISQLLRKYDLNGPFQLIGYMTTYRSLCISEYAEICLDKNIYKNTTDYEIEYEYKKEHDGLSVFESILQKVGLHYEKNCASKIARALYDKD